MTKRILSLLLLLALLPVLTSAQRGGRGSGHSSGGSTYVHGYTRSNGTYVAPHYRSAPDGNFYNNWSTKGNVNPYTGEEGTKVEPPPRRQGSFFSSSDSRAVSQPQTTSIPEFNISGTSTRPRTPTFISDGAFQYQTPRPESAAAPVEPEPAASVGARVEETVYITNTGAKYHRDGCQYLSRSKIPIKKRDAIARGYEPCKVCRP